MVQWNDFEDLAERLSQNVCIAADGWIGNKRFQKARIDFASVFIDLAVFGAPMKDWGNAFFNEIGIEFFSLQGAGGSKCCQSE